MAEIRENRFNNQVENRLKAGYIALKVG